MNKGCIITLAVAVLLCLLCCGGLGFYGFRLVNPAILMLVEQSIAEYRELYPEREVELTTKAWTQALIAEDSNIQSKQQLIDLLARLKTDEFTDLQKNPIRLNESADGIITATAAGKDKEFGTDDDVTSEPIMSLLERIGQNLEPVVSE